MTKVAIVILSDMESHSDTARVVNALHVAKEFKEAGDDVAIVFEGGGVVSAVTVADPDSSFHRPFALVQDKVAGLCRFCSRSFEVTDKAEALGLPFLADYEQHPSWRGLVEAGYQIITF
ncbi:MAG: DsrE family protein [Anaerolineae bacterium]|nr:DsrE family protein [Anaerolineae bacterium]